MNAVDGRADRLIKGGRGKDIGRVGPADAFKSQRGEIVKIVNSRHSRHSRCSRRPAGLRRPAGGRCARADRARRRPAPTFSNAFYVINTTITASADGITGDELPISIEDVCDVPQSLAAEVAQLVGGEGAALISPATQVFDATGQQLTGAAATTALADADSLAIKAQLLRPAGWRQDEDGEPVPTFSASRADITD